MKKLHQLLIKTITVIAFASALFVIYACINLLINLF
jgi:preprotein translocase subunit SecE